MNTLHSTTGISARIFELPGREPFMLAADLAEAYGTSVKALNQAVSRNQERFPNDFSFHLSEAEEDRMWSQIVTTSAKKRDDIRLRVYTHAGALMLSAVLKTPVAAEVSVIIHRAFAAMEKRALDESRFLLFKLQHEAAITVARRRIIDGVRMGLSFEAIWRSANCSRPKLAQAARDCEALGLIEALPAGTPAMQADLFSHGL